MSQQTNEKKSLSGVRIKVRKAAAKASAKHEPTVFRDQLYSHLETVPDGDFEGYYTKLIQAGSTLEYLKYADTLFEILFAGGLLQPGGQYVQDGAPPSPFSILKAKEPAEIDDLKKYVDVLNKLIRRYKYLQKPLEESSIPSLLRYIPRWEPEQREKLSLTVGILLSQGLANPACLQSLTKEGIVKDDIGLAAATAIFKAYLADQTMDQLASNLKKGGIKDLTTFLPPGKRNAKVLEEHFRKAGLPAVADYLNKKQLAQGKDAVMKKMRELLQDEHISNEEIIEVLKRSKEEQPVSEADFVGCIWQGLMASVDWSVKQDQIDANILKTIDKSAPVLEPFCESGKNQIALINTVQLYCYDEQRVMKHFSSILKVLYNKDCVSSQAIIYWHQKGSKTQGRAHFLASTEALVQALKKHEEDESEEEDE